MLHKMVASLLRHCRPFNVGFHLKMADYSADDSKVSILYKGSNVKAYGVFYILPEYIYVEEIAYDSSESLTEMLKKWQHWARKFVQNYLQTVSSISRSYLKDKTSRCCGSSQHECIP